MNSQFLCLPPEEQLELNQPVRFSVRFNPDLIRLTQQKLELARFPVEQSDFEADDWSQGAKVDRVQRLVQYWLDEFDWERQEVSIGSTHVQAETNLTLWLAEIPQRHV
jgi:hypothetical protein